MPLGKDVSKNMSELAADNRKNVEPAVRLGPASR